MGSLPKSESFRDRMPVYDASVMAGADMFNFSAGPELLSFPSKTLPSEDAVSSRPLGGGVILNFGHNIPKESVVSNSWKSYSMQGNGEWPGRFILSDVEYGHDSLATPLVLGSGVKDAAAPADAMQLYLMNPGYEAYPQVSIGMHQSTNVANQAQDTPKHVLQVPSHISSLFQSHSNTTGTEWESHSNELALLPSYSDLPSGQYFPSSRYYNTGSWHNRHSALQVPYQEPFVEEKLGIEFRAQPLSAASGEGSGQGLSLSLSSHQPSELPLQPVDTVANSTNVLQLSIDHVKNKPEELQTRNGAHGAQAHTSSYSRCVTQVYNNEMSAAMDLHMNVGPFTRYASFLRSSKFLKPAQQLLNEFCSTCKEVPQRNVPRQKISRNEWPGDRSFQGASNPQRIVNVKGETDGNIIDEFVASSSTTLVGKTCKESMTGEQLGCYGDRSEMQKRRTRLLSLLAELQRRYKQYHDRMQTIVTSFESVGDLGAAAPYTTLALKAMSRHFRCLKDAITGQLKVVSKVLGEEPSIPRLSIGETPRLRVIDQNLRQRDVHQFGMLEPHAWRPQRGLPERAVSLLRAWLFEHFLHPYPSDADKHLLARQTGLSRNQVSNWFINARVRLWKPMVEEMHELELKESSQTNKSSARTDIECKDNGKGSLDMENNIKRQGKMTVEGDSEKQTTSGPGGSSKLEHTATTSENGIQTTSGSMNMLLESQYFHGQNADATRELGWGVSRQFSQELHPSDTWEQQTKKRLRQGLETAVDYSYTSEKYSHESLTATQISNGNASVCLTLGLAQEKYSTALCFSREESMQGCNSGYEIHEIHDQGYQGGFAAQDLQLRKHVLGTQVLQ